MQSLVKKLQAKFEDRSSDILAMPYDRLGSGTCVLNTKPCYSTQLLNFVGWREEELCTELSDLFRAMIPKKGALVHGPIVQSLYIAPIESKGSRRYQVRLEIRIDDEHALDEEVISKRLREQTTKCPMLRHQMWFGALQTEKKKHFLFYSKRDFSGQGYRDMLAVDPDGIQEAFKAAGSQQLKHCEELIRLSAALQRFGYTQKLFIEGNTDSEEDGKRKKIRRPHEPPTGECALNLESVLDSIAKETLLSNVVIIHLDTAGLNNDSALSVPFRVNASDSGITRSYDHATLNLHRILALHNLSRDIFYLIGHKSEDVEKVFASIDFSSHALRSSSKSASSSAPTTTPLDSDFHTPYESKPHTQDTVKLLHTTDYSLDSHPKFLSKVFTSLASHRCVIAKLEGMRLIQGLDMSILVENMKTDFVVNALPNGKVVWPSHHIVDYPTYVMTIIGARLTSDLLKALVKRIAPHTFDFRCVRQLCIASSSRADYCPEDMALSSEVSRRNATEDEVAQMNEVDCLELLMTLRPELHDSAVEEEKLRASLKEIGLENGADVSVQRDSWVRRNKRVATFDMDSTLIQMECIDEMAQICGVGERVREITHRAMNGELDFAGALKERVSLLAGAYADQLFEQIVNGLWYTPHAKMLCHTLRALGCELAVLSGGFFPIISTVQQHLKLQNAHANRLAVDAATGQLTGQLLAHAPIIDADAKERILKKICTESYTDLDLSLAVGDGANDLKMLASAGLGIAFLAKTSVQERARFHINQLSLAPVLFLLGLHRDDCLTLLSER